MVYHVKSVLGGMYYDCIAKNYIFDGSSVRKTS